MSNQSSPKSTNLHISDIGDIRYANTRFLILSECDPKKPIKDFATRICVQPGYASGMASPNPASRSRPIGNIVARRIEAAFNKPSGWLDLEHTEETNSRFTTINEPMTVLTSDIANELANSHPNAALSDVLRDNQYAVIEHSHAMHPMKPGDWYLVKPNEEVGHGDIAVALVNGQLMAGIVEKGLQTFRLVFNNHREPPVDVTLMSICGRVAAQVFEPRASG